MYLPRAATTLRGSQEHRDPHPDPWLKPPGPAPFKQQQKKCLQGSGAKRSAVLGSTGPLQPLARESAKWVASTAPPQEPLLLAAPRREPSKPSSKKISRHLTEVASETSQGSVIVQLAEESECVEPCFCHWPPREGLARLAQPSNTDPQSPSIGTGGRPASQGVRTAQEEV